jgi:uncharacterized membrane protein YkvA (DUF1232 family)
MSNDKMQYPERAGDVGTLMGWLKDFFGHFRLAWELLWDDRVPFVTKIIPILTLLYVISPVDLVPGMVVPGLGQLDDLAVFLIGLRLFIDVCPPALVAEHQEDARLETTTAPPEVEQPEANTRPSSVTWTPPVGQIIDLEAKVVNHTDTDADANASAEEKPKPSIPHVW